MGYSPWGPEELGTTEPLTHLHPPQLKHEHASVFFLHCLHSNNEDYLSKGNCVISTKVLLFIPNSKKSYSIMFFQ